MHDAKTCVICVRINLTMTKLGRYLLMVHVYGLAICAIMLLLRTLPMLDFSTMRYEETHVDVHQAGQRHARRRVELEGNTILDVLYSVTSPLAVLKRYVKIKCFENHIYIYIYMMLYPLGCSCCA